MTEGQCLALRQLQRIENANSHALEITETRQPEGDAAWAEILISVHCGGFLRAGNGLPLRDRERFRLLIPPDFPFTIPRVYASHHRFAGWPHVQWKNYLCLYQAPQTEWIPSDGMYGFIGRLEWWLRQAAKDELDPLGGPLHPPVVYGVDQSSTILMPSKNTPEPSDSFWVGLARLELINENTYSITEWIDPSDDLNPGYYGTALLLSQPMPFEFPRKASQLLDELKVRGPSLRQVILALQLAVIRNENDQPLFFIVGTPMRGIRGDERLQQHLVAWEIEPIVAKALRISVERYSTYGHLQEIGEQAEQIFMDWVERVELKWCRIFENRDEIITRRDQSSRLGVFRGKVISIWGCGALGASVAIYLAQAGARKLILRDSGIVKPGILVRQPFRQVDVGLFKVEALAHRLRDMRGEILIDTFRDDIKTWLLGEPDWSEGADLIIDSTASNIVHVAFEKARLHVGDTRVPIMSMLIDDHAQLGLLVCAGKDYSGGVADVYRKALIYACNEEDLRPFADAFYPTGDRQSLFQPEPGCSSPTFVGSAADTATLSGLMLNLSGELLSCGSTCSGAAYVSQREPASCSLTRWSWEADQCCIDQLSGYTVRVSSRAWNEIIATINASERKEGPDVETGGLLFGRRDDVLKILWVDEVSGPPPDSILSEHGFVCGISGAKQLNAEKRSRTRNMVGCVGAWHTHPRSLPFPSRVDVAGMAQIVMAPDFASDKSLLLIVQPQSHANRVGSFLFDVDDFTSSSEKYCDLDRLASFTPRRKSPHIIGLALSGGGSRAIAFHLGCLRARHDRRLLGDVSVISAVSGGSVIAAMYAYGDDDFEEFDRMVVSLLRDGLDVQIAKEFFMSMAVLREAFNYLVGVPSRLIARLAWSGPFIERWPGRTASFIKVLQTRLFSDLKISAPRRDDIDLVFNATEMTTGTAFRFGTKESGCWRFGKVRGNDVAVAQAVAASAAHPAFLPSIVTDFAFEHDETVEKRRVVLSDGGIYDNLGVTCMAPDRDPEYSTNIFQPDYIICCNAGYGMFEGTSAPFYLLGRLKRTSDTLMRRMQDSVMKDLHQFKQAGQIKGFVLSYLGQQDDKLPFFWPEMVRREEVDYPTDFRPMRDVDIVRLSARGEHLTRLLIEYYCPEL